MHLESYCSKSDCHISELTKNERFVYLMTSNMYSYRHRMPPICLRRTALYKFVSTDWKYDVWTFNVCQIIVQLSNVVDSISIVEISKSLFSLMWLVAFSHFVWSYRNRPHIQTPTTRHWSCRQREQQKYCSVGRHKSRRKGAREGGEILRPGKRN